MKSILIVGGAGYIGSHVVKAVAKAGYHPVTLDNYIVKMTSVEEACIYPKRKATPVKT